MSPMAFARSPRKGGIHFRSALNMLSPGFGQEEFWASGRGHLRERQRWAEKDEKHYSTRKLGHARNFQSKDDILLTFKCHRFVILCAQRKNSKDLQLWLSTSGDCALQGTLGHVCHSWGGVLAFVGTGTDAANHPTTLRKEGPHNEESLSSTLVMLPRQNSRTTGCNKLKDAPGILKSILG